MKIVTTTGIKAPEAVKAELSMEVIREKLGAKDAPAFKKADDLPIGVWVAENENDSFTVYTVEDRDIVNEYEALSEDDRTKCWQDGYKRQHVNNPVHRHVKEALGIVTKTGVTKAVDRVLWDVAMGLATAGFSIADIQRHSQGRVGAEMAEAAINKVAAELKATHGTPTKKVG